MMITDPLKIVVSLADVFEQLSVDYILGGSLASSIHGIPRASQDADMVAALEIADIEPLLEVLEDDFYVDSGAVREAIEQKKSFNIIHLETMFKIDIFVPDFSGLTGEIFSRRRAEEIIEGKPVYVYSPEDIILGKLDWYRKGKEVSDRQWQDVLGVMKVQGSNLDLEYLIFQTERHGLRQLLDRALEQAGLHS